MSSEPQSPRLAPLSMAEVSRIAAEAGIPAELTDRNLFRILLHSPRVAKAIQELLYAQLFGATFDGRLRELIIMRIGWATACDYEWAQHWRTGQVAFGCTADDLLAVREWRLSPRFGAVERAVLAATDEILATGTISPETWALCQTHLGSPQACLELVTVIATWHLISQVARSLQIPLEGDTPSWPPDGRFPSNGMTG
jgi:alkylhydroperoxidase family enzyme